MEIFQPGPDRLEDALINGERRMVHSWRTEIQMTLEPAQTTVPLHISFTEMWMEISISYEQVRVTGCLLGSPSGHLRWSPCLKEREEDLDHTDYRRLVLLFIEDVGQQLLYSLLSRRGKALELTSTHH